MTKNQNNIYMAGIIDGEGCVTIRKVYYQPREYNLKYPMYNIICNVANTDKRLLYWIKKNYDGNIYKYVHKNKRYKDAYHWQVARRKAYIILRKIYPYLVVEKKRAEICMRFQEGALDIGKNKLKEMYYQMIKQTRKKK